VADFARASHLDLSGVTWAVSVAGDFRTRGQASGQTSRKGISEMYLGQSATSRQFLFLQGLATPFFFRLGEKLKAAGAGVHRINISAGDALFWPTGGAVNYRGTLRNWGAFVSEYIEKHGITDVILLGDCWPYHRVALARAKRRDVRVHVYEDGYIRPNWITLEEGGINGNSSLPRDAKEIIRLSRRIPEMSQSRPARGNFRNRVVWEFGRNIADIVMRPLFPNYVRHRAFHPLVELAGWTRRVLGLPVMRHKARKIMKRLTEGDESFLLCRSSLIPTIRSGATRRSSRWKSCWT